MSTLAELLADAPNNWQRWGSEDEVGALNLLTPAEVVRGLQAAKQGRVFALGARMCDPGGDPLWPGRAPTLRLNTQDRASYVYGKAEAFVGGSEYADDAVTMFLQGTTHMDGLGHTWYDGQMYNGYSADTTVDRMEKASILPLAERGVVGRAVLVDIARHLGRPHLSRGETFTLADVLAALERQKVTFEKRDILLIRTGWLTLFYHGDRTEFYREPFTEPGLAFSLELVEWFRDMEIPALATDTLGNEATRQPDTGVMSILHAALMRNLGVTFHEILMLDKLAEDCAQDGQYTFLYVASPLKITGGTGAPMNPIAIK